MKIDIFAPSSIQNVFKSNLSLGDFVCRTFLVTVLIFWIIDGFGQQSNKWVQYEGSQGAGKGKHIVLISGDEEYRSEEGLPMIAKILARRHGFKCTVLFSIDPASGAIDPTNQTNIPGLELLKDADLVFMLIRFRELPDEQMKHIDEYLLAGKPVIGLRTSTHAFNYKRNKNSPYAKYDFESSAANWVDGFGKVVLGETWVDHHGDHGEEGTRALINGLELKANNPLLKGVQDIWVPTDVYGVRRLPQPACILLFGQTTSGMSSDAPPNLEKSIMPVAWTKKYQLPDGREGKAFATTMGASVDLVNEDLRRLLVNACYWATGMEDKIPEKADVKYVGKYEPTMFGFEKHKRGVLPQVHEMK